MLQQQCDEACKFQTRAFQRDQAAAVKKRTQPFLLLPPSLQTPAPAGNLKPDTLGVSGNLKPDTLGVSDSEE
jgi:hypothetical protein